MKGGRNFSEETEVRTSRHTQIELGHLAFVHFNNNISDLMPRCGEQTPGWDVHFTTRVHELGRSSLAVPTIYIGQTFATKTAKIVTFRTQKLSVPFCLELIVQLRHTYRPEICSHCLRFPRASGRPDGWTVVGVPGWKDDGQRKLGAYWERHARQKQGKRTTPTIPSTVYPPACSSMHGDIHTHSRHTHACRITYRQNLTCKLTIYLQHKH